MIFDTHAHYDDEAFDIDREELLLSLKTHGIGTVVNVGANAQTLEKTIELTQRYPFVYGALGVHPDSVDKLDEERFAWLKQQLAAHSKLLAVGEIGLDYYWDTYPRDVQKHWFIRQMELARELKKPMIIHSREAAEDTFDILKTYHAEEIGGVIHCFSYSVELAREAVRMGFYLGIGGVLTFKNARRLKEVVEYVPLERLVLETDCPYLAPTPHRSERNDSRYLPFVVKELATIKGINEEEVIAVTEQNARKMYRLE